MEIRHAALTAACVTPCHTEVQSCRTQLAEVQPRLVWAGSDCITASAVPAAVQCMIGVGLLGGQACRLGQVLDS